MKIKTSKTLANILNKNIKDFTIKQANLNIENFKNFVDFDILEHENDYNYNNNTFSVFIVQYPNNYYACDKYITTNDLVKIYKKITNKTLVEV